MAAVDRLTATDSPVAVVLAHVGGVVGVVLLIGIVAFFGLVWLHARSADDSGEQDAREAEPP